MHSKIFPLCLHGDECTCAPVRMAGVCKCERACDDELGSVVAHADSMQQRCRNRYAPNKQMSKSVVELVFHLHVVNEALKSAFGGGGGGRD